MPRVKDLSKPHLSSKAREALREISDKNYDIKHRLDDLSEADLKAVADRAREDARVYSVWTGTVAEAERRLDLLERYRTGRGKWIALVEAVDWDAPTNSGSTRILAQSEHDTKSAAAAEARKQLVKHADELGESTRIEAYIVSEVDDEIREGEAT